MSRQPAWRRYLRFWGPRAERDVDDEFRFHLESKIEDLRAAGLGEQDARREALRQFGPVKEPRAECVAVEKTLYRRASRIDYLRGWLADLRFATRVLRKARASSSAAILILAIGIGATTAVFTLLDRLLYEPLPVPEASRLAIVSHWEIGANGKRLGGQTFQYADYVYIRDHAAVFAAMGAEATLVGRERHAHQRIDHPAAALMVSGNFFDVLRVPPLYGRALTPADDIRSAPSHVAVAGYRFAAHRWPLPQDALGKIISLQDIPFTIIGVLPPWFFGTQKGYDNDLYVPLSAEPELVPGMPFDDAAFLRPIARLRPGVDLERAGLNLEVLWRQIRSARTKREYDNDRIFVESGEQGYAGTAGQQQRSLELLGVIAALLMLIGCANVACLLVARSAARQQETAIRLSLGAGRSRILRQSFVESSLLALCGCAGALAVAHWACRLLVIGFHWQKRAIDLAPDARVLGFAIAASCVSAILFGLAPALRMLRGGRVPLTRSAAAAPFSSGRVLVCAEIAFSLVMLAGAAVFIRSFQNLRAVPTGFVAGGVTVVRLDRNTDDDAKPPLREAFELASALRRHPSIRSVTLANFVVFNDGYVMSSVRLSENSKPVPMRRLMVAPGYWDTLRIPLIAGRGFTARDDERAPRVGVLNESFAARLFPDQNPIGRQVYTGRLDRPLRPEDAVEVVGIVKDSKFTQVSAPAPNLLYLPLMQGETNTRKVVLEARSSLDSAAVGALVLSQIRAGRLPLVPQSSTALNDEVGASLREDYIRMQATSLLGAIALVLIASGLYGLMAYTVARRTVELGIRTAVGARVGDIVLLVLRQSMTFVMIGIALGIPGAVLAVRALSGMVFGLPPVDVPSLIFAGSILAVTGAAASFVPAWRAAHLDPVQALRTH